MRIGGSLTGRQADLLNYVARGWDRQTIASQMGLPEAEIGGLLKKSLIILSGRRPAHDQGSSDKDLYCCC